MTDTSPAAVEHTVAHMRLCYGKDYSYAAMIEALASERDAAQVWAREQHTAADRYAAQLTAANQRAEMLANSLATARADGYAEGVRDAADCIPSQHDLIDREGDRQRILALISTAPAAPSSEADLGPRLCQFCLDAGAFQCDCISISEPSQTVQWAAKDLLDALTSGAIDPLDAIDPEIEALAIKHSGNRGDPVIQLEIAEEFFVAALRAIAGGRDE